MHDKPGFSLNSDHLGLVGVDAVRVVGQGADPEQNAESVGVSAASPRAWRGQLARIGRISV